MITVVLADDHKVVRQGLRVLLSAEPDFSIVGEAGDGLEAIQMVERFKPNVLALDLQMSGMNGLEATHQLTKHHPQTGIVILSMHGTESYVIEARRAGAKAYVLKESTTEELGTAVREVAVGHRYLGAPISERTIDAYLQKSEGAIFDPFDTLTDREREVLQLAAEGKTNAEIAQRLYLSRRTVEIHRANMMRKLGLRTQTQLVQYAIQRGILPGG